MYRAEDAQLTRTITFAALAALLLVGVAAASLYASPLSLRLAVAGLAGAAALLGLGLATHLAERRRAERALRAAGALLEKREAQRSAELDAASAELARALRFKDEFLAIVSHELRTPLTSIIGRAEALAELAYGPLNERQAQAIGGIEASGRHLLGLINTILDLSQAEAGKIELDRSSVQVATLVTACLQAVGEAAQARQLAVSAEVDPAVGRLAADERRLKQILVSLLANAVKFTPPGGGLGLTVRGDVAAAQVHFTVWDSGIGVAAEDQGRLFQPFVQLDGGLARQHGGVGLGLALVHGLVGLHGGSVAVDSAAGQGSRFTVTLPWSPPSEPAGGPAAAPESGEASAQAGAAGEPPLVALVEDNEATIELLEYYLSHRGYNVQVARDGREGLALIAAARPSIVLMDIQMPGLDGLEAIRRIRKTAGLEQLPIVALTALAMVGDRERCLQAGASAYLSKPVVLRELLATIERYRSRPATRP